MKKIVGYFPNWAVYRKGSAKFGVEDINPKLFTHLIYAFAILDENNFSIKAFDNWNDIENEGFKKFTKLKRENKELKVMIAIGGWTDSQTIDNFNKYSALVASDRNIEKFVDSSLKFLKEYGFDGLDLDWEYPSTTQDKNGFSKLISALKSKFKPHGYLLSAAVPGSSDAITNGYFVHALNENLDFINLMAYDFYGPWEKTQANHHSPLEAIEGEKNVKSAVKNWLSNGMEAAKINLGIPLYGKCWELSCGGTCSCPFIPPLSANGPGSPGPSTKEAGTMAYFEICDAVRNKGWKVYNSSIKVEEGGWFSWLKSSSPSNSPRNEKMGPYAVSPSCPKMWVGYDDPNMVAVKSQYILSKNLGGAMLWDISFDDFEDGKKSNPVLTNAIYRTLNP